MGSITTNKQGIATLTYPVALDADDVGAQRSRLVCSAYTTDIAWGVCLKATSTPTTTIQFVVEPVGYEITIQWILVQIRLPKTN